MPDSDRVVRTFQASTVFTPGAPISKEALFAGRQAQIARLVDAINQPSLHAVLFGERGVGKTSLANVLNEKWQGSGFIIAPRIGCLSSDSWADVWQRALREISLAADVQRAGFRRGDASLITDAAMHLPENFSITDVRSILTKIGDHGAVVLLFDEFDTLNSETRKAMAETTKHFSDYSVPVTLIMVGVADSVAGLIHDHQSLERALIQVQMPRMQNSELKQIIDNGLQALNLTIQTDALSRILQLSSGLPNYTHLLGLHASRAALRRGGEEIEAIDVEVAIKTALDDSQQSYKDAYAKATDSPQKNHLYRQVLLACALAETNDSAFFTAAAVRDPLSKIMGKAYDIPSYARHLNEFSDEKRGNVLERQGSARNYKFRFRNPLMQPHVILHGYASGMIA